MVRQKMNYWPYFEFESEFILVGNLIVSEKEFKLRMLTKYIEDAHHYCLHLNGGKGMII